jgi:Ca2+-binding EF-hand superfamily protein
LAPLEPQIDEPDYDEKTAIESLQKVRNINFDTETKTVFSHFDKDKDGFVSRSELKNKLQSLAVL